MKNTMILGWLNLEKALFLREIEAFRDYIKQSKSSIKGIQSDFEKWWEKQVAEHPEDADELNWHYEDEIDKTFHLLPHIAFSSLYISISSLYENSLKKACGTVKHPEIKLTWSDMAGDKDFKKSARTFLTKVALIDLKSIEKPWSQVAIFWQLRNRIVHQGSKITVNAKGEIDDKEVARLFKKYAKSIELKNSEFNFTGTQILLEYLAAIEQIIIGLYELLGKRLLDLKEKEDKKKTVK